MDLPHSDACFVKAYPAETTEAFCDGHNAAFAFFGGVPLSMLYDNTRLAVARLTHHVHILEMNGESYRLAQSKRRRRGVSSPADRRPPEAQ